jgi:glycosyltransferase involved in cell wall biosynthesis
MPEPSPSALVSVVIPTYNRAYCVARAIDSALSQTHRKVEVIVVDDGSADGTRALIRQRYGRKRRVRYLYQDNAGVSEARNTGLDAAQGAFVGLLDSDDWWYPWKLQAQLAALHFLPQAGMVWTDMEAVDPRGRVIDPRYLRTMLHAYHWWNTQDLFTARHPLSQVAPELREVAGWSALFVGDVYSHMIMGNLIPTPTVLLRRERLDRVGRFNSNLKSSGEDYDFHLRTCREGPVAFLDLATMRCSRGLRDHLSDPTHKYEAAKNVLTTVHSVLNRDGPRITLPKWMIRRSLADAYAWVAQEAAVRGKRGQALSHGLWSLWYKPWQSAVLRPMLRSLLPAGSVELVKRVMQRTEKRA